MYNQRIERVLLISLPAIMAKGMAENDFNISHAFNLGLAYLGGLLRRNGIQVQILDCLVEDPHNIRSAENEWFEVGLSDERILAAIGEFDADLVGISIPFSYQHHMAMLLAGKIKLAFPNVIIAVGGNHVTAVPETIDLTHVDYLTIGEGEHPLLHLIRALNRNQSANEIPGIAARNAAAFQRAPFITDLDSLPFPAIDLLPLREIWGDGRRWINMVATRGCVYDCVFCSIHTVMGHAVRRRSVENVIAEIKHWHKLYQVQEIYFEDDNLTINTKWAKELFRQIAANKFGIRFYARNGIRADTVDRELLRLMKAAGYQDFAIAPETGSQETLDKIIGKKMKLDDCTRAVRLAREAGLHTSAFFVIGFPEESLEDIQTTLSYARHLKEIGCAGFWFSLAVPYPGTRLFDQCLENGQITRDFDYRRLRVAKSVILNNNYSLAQLETIRSNIMDELSPPRLSYLEKLNKGLAIFFRDPPFFFSKLRHKLGIVHSKFMNQRILQNAAVLLLQKTGVET